MSEPIKGHIQEPMEVHSPLTLNSKILSLGNHNSSIQCAQLTAFLSFNAFNLSSEVCSNHYHFKEFFRRLTWSGVFTLDFMLFLWCCIASTETFLKGLFYLIDMLRGLFVCVRVHVPVCLEAITRKKPVSGVWEMLLQALWAAWVAAWIRTLVLMMKPCFPHCTASQVYHFQNFFFHFHFLLYSLLCLLCTVFVSFIFYLSVPLMYSRSLVSVWKKQVSKLTKKY